MISSFCRPASRPPEMKMEPSKQQSKEVSFAAQPGHEESPRSCTKTDLFLGEAAADEVITPPADDAKDDVEEETPSEVALLLTSVADIASQEIKAGGPPIMSALADAFPRFPDLSDGNNEDMDYEMEQQPEDSGPALMHFNHISKKRAVSMDIPEKRVVEEPLTPPASPLHEEEAIPTLLQWRNVRGETASPPHQYGIFSTPPPSPIASRKKRHPMVPNSDYRRSDLHSSAKGHHNRPRAVSMAEKVEQVPLLDLTAPATVNEKQPTKLILRKKFSWKNYPELEEFLIGELFHVACKFIILA